MSTDKHKNPETTNSQEKDRLAESLQYAHENFGVPLNVSEVVSRTLDKNGFKPLESDQTPSVEEWISERVTSQGYAGYNHGSFVVDATGNLGFAKVHYGPDNILITIDEDGNTQETKVGGPKREAEVLRALEPNGYDTPQVLAYSPALPEGASNANAETFETLIIEAVTPEYGSVRKREEWSPSLARRAAQKISTFAKPVESIPLFKDESIPLTVESLIQKVPRDGGEYDAALTRALDTYTHLDSPVVVHGDVWFNNTIARHDDSDVMFIDWELAGPGYRGQDAGRKLWDLTLKNDWSFAGYSEAARAFTDEWCKTEDDKHSLTFGVMYESLRWISDRIDKVIDPDTDEATQTSLLQEIEDVKSHALAITGNINQN